MLRKPFATSCEENKLPILEVLKKEFRDKSNVLEIGSGTGQHAVFFAEQLNHLTWQPSDRAENLAGISAWVTDSTASNISTPLTLDVALDQWPKKSFDGVFSANTAHIMGWQEVEKMFQGVAQILKKHGCFCLYGPFNYDGKFTSESNARFELWLKAQNPVSGIRDMNTLEKLANGLSLQLTEDYEMPANNRILVWRKQA